MNDLKAEILALARNDLAEIEKELENNLTTYLDLVHKTASHILFSGGKRLRPLLMVLSARICNYKGHYDKTFSVIFEYLHAATLLHDDLVDDASLRRGKPVAHSIWDNSTAVLVGDYLLSRVLSIAAGSDKIKIIKIIAKITEEMTQGEVHQLMRKGNLNLSEEEYFEVIQHKTAVLIQGACQTGAVLADAPEKEEKALADYGYNMGIAFQMADDLLDYMADTDTLGKEIGTDLREGKLTLPVIHALENANPEDREIMESIIKKNEFSLEEFEIFKALIKKNKGIAYTKQKAEKHITRAKNAILIFNKSEAMDLMIKLADYALLRQA